MYDALKRRWDSKFCDKGGEKCGGRVNDYDDDDNDNYDYDDNND